MDHRIPSSWLEDTPSLPEPGPELPDTSADEPPHECHTGFEGLSGQSLTQNLEDLIVHDVAHDEFGFDIHAAHREPEIPEGQPEHDQEQPDDIALPEHEPKPVPANANAKATDESLAGKPKAAANAAPLAGTAKTNAGTAEALPAAAKAKAKAKAKANAKANADAKAEADYAANDEQRSI
jgi:hypothetical protein